MKVAALCFASLMLACARVMAPPSAPVAGQEENKPITDVEQIFKNSNAVALEAHRVDFRAVEVQEVINDRFALIGPSRERVVLLRLQQPARGLKAGHRVAVTGNINQIGAQLEQGWNLTADQARRIKGHRIFINATSARPAQQKTPASSTNSPAGK